MISTPTADGSLPDTRTIRDSGPQRGRFRSGPRTFRDIDSQRGWFDPWYPHHPRFRPPSVDGSALDPAPSMKSTSTADGSLPDTRTIRDSGPSVDGSALDAFRHPRRDRGSSGEKSRLPNSYPPDGRTFLEMQSHHGRSLPEALDHPRCLASAWKVHPCGIEPSSLRALSMEGPLKQRRRPDN